MKTNLIQKKVKVILSLGLFTILSLSAQNELITRVIEGEIEVQRNSMYVIKHKGGQTLPASNEYGTLILKQDSTSIPIKFTVVIGNRLICHETFIEHENKDTDKIWIILEK